MTTKKEPKRKVGRPRKDDALRSDIILSFRVTPSEAKALKDLIEDTKADNFTALIRNFISVGLLNLVSTCQPTNKVFYQRFARHWDFIAHLKMYSDDMGKQMKLQEQINLLKKPKNC